MAEYAVIGLGQFGFQVAVSLSELGGEVLAIDRDRRIVEAIKNRVDRAVCIDCTDEAALRSSGAASIDTVIVAIGQHLEISVITTALLRKAGVAKIIARASTPLHAQILDLIGAQRVLNPEEMMAIQLAQSLFTPEVRNRIAVAPGLVVAEIEARAEFVDKTLLDLNFRSTYNLNVIAIKRRIPVITDDGENAFREETNVNPGATTVIQNGDVIVLVGNDREIRKLARAR